VDGRRTDRDGRLTLTWPEKSFPREPLRIGVHAPGFPAGLSRTFTPSVEKPPEIRVVLGRAHRVSGRVVHEDGTPAPGITVWVEAPGLVFKDPRLPLDWLARPAVPEEAEQRRFLQGFSGASDDAGFFEIADLPEGPYRILALSPVPEPDSSLPAIVTLGELVGAARRPRVLELAGVPSEASGVRLAVPRAYTSPSGGTVELSVTDAATGLPLAGARGVLVRPGGEVHGTPGPPGVVRLSPVPPGTWTVVVEREEYAPAVRTGIEVPTADRNVTVSIALERGVTVRGRLRNRPEAGGFGPLVHLSFLDLELSVLTIAQAKLGEDGTYEARGLRPGRHRVSFNSWPPGIVEPSVVTIPGGTSEVTVDLEVRPGAALRLGIRAPYLAHRVPGQEPHEEALRRAEGTRLQVRAADGRVVWERAGFTFLVSEAVPLPLGDYTVRLEVPGLLPREEKVTVGERGASVDLVITR